MIRTSVLFIFTFTLLQPIFTQTNQRKEALQEVLNRLIQRNEFNGSIIYSKNGKIILEKSNGNVNAFDSIPITLHSRFNLASLTKSFMGVLTLKVKEAYPFNLEDPVNMYLKNFPYENIQIQHLLTHTSGLPEYFQMVEEQTGPLDTLHNTDVLNLLIKNHTPLNFEPGNKFQYNNTGFLILSLILEEITSKTIFQLMDDYLIQPYTLNETIAFTIDSKIPFTGRVKGIKNENGRLIENDLQRIDGVFGDGNLYSSTHDLFKWIELLRLDKLFTKKNYSNGFQPFKLNDGSFSNYGYGIKIDSTDIQYSHTGSWVGFYNYIATNKKSGESVIVLTNNSDPSAIKAIQDWYNFKPFTFEKTTLITNVRVLDGTGLPERKESLRIKGDKILEMGSLKPFIEEEVIDGNGKILAPGFIDTHSHHYSGLVENPEALPVLSQGITTICIGQDGSSYPMDTLFKRYKEQPPAINILSYTGHASLRVKQMGMRGLYRIATQKEIDAMVLNLEEELKKGSFGLSSGLEYESGFFSNKSEVLQLAEIAAKYKSRYMSHIRSEDIQIENAIDEIIQIGEHAKLPVQISHIKIAQRSKWGTSPAIIQKLQSARQRGILISADIYPYTFWNSTLRVLYPNRDYDNPIASQFAVNQLFDPKESILLKYAANKNFAGKTISEIANMMNKTEAETLQFLVAEAAQFEEDHPDYEESIETIMGKAMSEEDLKTFLAWPFTNICSDGAFSGHPRGRGTYPKVLADYVRKDNFLTLPNAIYKMTGLCAENLGLHSRGILKSGNYADLVLFDPMRIQDNATVITPNALSDGVIQVWVNGISVYKEGKSENNFPGRVLTRE